MEYVSKDALLELLANTENEERKYLLNYLLTSYKFEQWQTIDEFNVSPVNWWCWIYTVNLSTKMCFFSDKVFYTTNELTGFYVPTNITHVMPVKTPEAPK